MCISLIIHNSSRQNIFVKESPMLDENKGIPTDVEENKTKEKTTEVVDSTFTAKKDFKTPIIFGKHTYKSRPCPHAVAVELVLIEQPWQARAVRSVIIEKEFSPNVIAAFFA